MNDAAKRAAIRAIYAQLAAPDWASPNLDGLADVLRDLSWLPAGTVVLTLPDLSDLDADSRTSLQQVLARAVDDSIDSDRPVRVR